MKGLKNIAWGVIVLFISSFSFSQLLMNKEGIEEIEKLEFNTAILLQNRIRSIHTEYMIKKELSPIIKKPHITEYYEYDNVGDMIMYYKTFLLHDTVYDTLVEYYSYDEQNLLNSKRRSEYGKFGAYEYTYQEGQIIKMEHSFEENSSTSKLNFIPKNRVLEEIELYQIQPLDSLSFIRYTLSQDKVRYKEKEVIYENGRLKKMHDRLLFGPQKYDVYHYAYFEDDLIKKEIVDNYTSQVKKQYIYTYKENKNISSIKIYSGQGEKHLYTVEFLYKEDTGLLEAVLKKEEATGTIEITKFKYIHY